MARVNRRCTVGTSNVPTMAAKAPENVRIWKSQNNASPLLGRSSSIRFDEGAGPETNLPRVTPAPAR